MSGNATLWGLYIEAQLCQRRVLLHAANECPICVVARFSDSWVKLNMFFTCTDCSDHDCGSMLARSCTAAWHCSSEELTHNWSKKNVFRNPLKFRIWKKLDTCSPVVKTRTVECNRCNRIHSRQTCPLQLPCDVQDAMLAICMIDSNVEL